MDARRVSAGAANAASLAWSSVTRVSRARLAASRKAGRAAALVGGHLDSWHTASGATDNADGAVAVMEAARILCALGAEPRRTIRFALWSGEEQGLLGARART